MTREFRDDYEEQPAWWYKIAWRDFDSDTWVFVWWPLFPFARLYAWWFRARRRRKARRLLRKYMEVL